MRVLDFGLAQFDEADTLTAVGDVPGTLAYISPERLAGEEAIRAQRRLGGRRDPLGGARRQPSVLGRAASPGRLARSPPAHRPSLPGAAIFRAGCSPPSTARSPSIPEKRPPAARLAAELREAFVVPPPAHDASAASAPAYPRAPRRRAAPEGSPVPPCAAPRSGRPRGARNGGRRLAAPVLACRARSPRSRSQRALVTLAPRGSGSRSYSRRRVFPLGNVAEAAALVYGALAVGVARGDVARCARRARLLRGPAARAARPARAAPPRRPAGARRLAAWAPRRRRRLRRGCRRRSHRQRPAARRRGRRRPRGRAERAPDRRPLRARHRPRSTHAAIATTALALGVVAACCCRGLARADAWGSPSWASSRPRSCSPGRPPSPWPASCSAPGSCAAPRGGAVPRRDRAGAAARLARGRRPAPMSVLRAIENKIEGLFEGVFGRAFRTHVQPVELARKLAKEMDEHRSVSVSRVYVPNEYTLYLVSCRPRAVRGVRGLARRRAAGVPRRARAPRGLRAAHAAARAAARRTTDLAIGEFGIATRVGQADEAGAAPPPAPVRPRRAAPPRPPGTARRAASRDDGLPSRDALAGDDGPSPRRRASRSTLTVDGRDVPLTTEPGRGRPLARVRHPGRGRQRLAAALRARAGGADRVGVVDLGSTNGTEVNGKRVGDARALDDGDRITIGGTELVFGRSRALVSVARHDRRGAARPQGRASSSCSTCSSGWSCAPRRRGLSAGAPAGEHRHPGAGGGRASRAAHGIVRRRVVVLASPALAAGHGDRRSRARPGGTGRRERDPARRRHDRLEPPRDDRQPRRRPLGRGRGLDERDLRQRRPVSRRARLLQRGRRDPDRPHRPPRGGRRESIGRAAGLTDTGRRRLPERGRVRLRAAALRDRRRDGRRPGRRARLAARRRGDRGGRPRPSATRRRSPSVVRAANARIFERALARPGGRRHGDDGDGRRSSTSADGDAHARRTSATRARTAIATDALEQLTTDHSLVAELVRSGRLTEAEAAVASAPVGDHARARDGGERGGRHAHARRRARRPRAALLGRAQRDGARRRDRPACSRRPARDPHARPRALVAGGERRRRRGQRHGRRLRARRGRAAEAPARRRARPCRRERRRRPDAGRRADSRRREPPRGREGQPLARAPASSLAILAVGALALWWSLVR